MARSPAAASAPAASGSQRAGAAVASGSGKKLRRDGGAARAPLAPARQLTTLGVTVITGTALAPPPDGERSDFLPPRFQESLDAGSTAQQSSSRPPNSRMAQLLAAGSRAAAPRPARAGARRGSDARVCAARSTGNC